MKSASMQIKTLIYANIFIGLHLFLFYLKSCTKINSNIGAMESRKNTSYIDMYYTESSRLCITIIYNE